MGYSLGFTKGRGLDYISERGWLDILKLARRYGWVPAGIKWIVAYDEGSMPDCEVEQKMDEEYANQNNGSGYTGNGGQITLYEGTCREKVASAYRRVNASDAANLRLALVKARDEIRAGALKPGSLIHELATYPGGMKTLNGVIRVCGDGAFCVM